MLARAGEEQLDAVEAATIQAIADAIQSDPMQPPDSPEVQRAKDQAQTDAQDALEDRDGSERQAGARSDDRDVQSDPTTPGEPSSAPPDLPPSSSFANSLAYAARTLRDAGIVRGTIDLFRAAGGATSEHVDILLNDGLIQDVLFIASGAGSALQRRVSSNIATMAKRAHVEDADFDPDAEE
jgi:hypothetical protein